MAIRRLAWDTGRPNYFASTGLARGSVPQLLPAVNGSDGALLKPGSVYGAGSGVTDWFALDQFDSLSVYIDNYASASGTAINLRVDAGHNLSYAGTATLGAAVSTPYTAMSFSNGAGSFTLRPTEFTIPVTAGTHQSFKFDLKEFMSPYIRFRTNKGGVTAAGSRMAIRVVPWSAKGVDL